jgi:hypothetical protein
MQNFYFRRFYGIVLSSAVLCIMLLVAGCATTGSNAGQSTAGATPAIATPVPPTATATVLPPTPTAAPVAFKAGGISFIGPVKSVTSSSLVMSAPNGQTFTLAISPQTDLSGFNGSLPAVGASVDMDSAENPNGSFTATILKPARAGDPDLNVIAYTGITTSAVGADRVIHLTVGIKNYSFPIPATADLSSFGSNAQAIGPNVSVKVKVQFPGNTVVSIANTNS